MIQLVIASPSPIKHVALFLIILTLLLWNDPVRGLTLNLFESFLFGLHIERTQKESKVKFSSDILPLYPAPGVGKNMTQSSKTEMT
eukprot:6229851-Ditylum_brightwellii.AAC.1